MAAAGRLRCGARPAMGPAGAAGGCPGCGGGCPGPALPAQPRCPCAGISAAPPPPPPRCRPSPPPRSRPRCRRRVPGQTPGGREGAWRGSRARPPPAAPRGWRRPNSQRSATPTARGSPSAFAVGVKGVTPRSQPAPVVTSLRAALLKQCGHPFPKR